MIRSNLAEQLDDDPHFSWRGKTVTRIENLSDIVFALALGMLVSASSPPQTLTDLQQHMINIIPVAGGFLMMLVIWHAHFTFFRRYGVADGAIVALNAALLLLVLFVAYPLRFIFDNLLAFIIGNGGNDWSRMEAMGVSNYRQAGAIMGYFSVGYATIYLLINRMYGHVLRKSDVL